MSSKKAKSKKTKTPMNKNTKILIYTLAGIVFLVTIILIAFENVPNRFVVRNNTEKNLEYIKAYFVDEEGPFTETIQFESLKKGDTAEIDLGKIDFSYLEANLELRFKFEGYDELFVDTGYFNEVFDGKITVTFTDKDDKVLLHVKAMNGILPNPNINCDDEYVVNLEEGYVED